MPSTCATLVNSKAAICTTRRSAGGAFAQISGRGCDDKMWWLWRTGREALLPDLIDSFTASTFALGSLSERARLDGFFVIAGALR